MKLRKIKQDTLRFFGHFFLTQAVSVLCKTLKVNKINYEVIKKLNEQKQNYVLAFWHGTMTLPWYLHRNSGFAALISKSKDGNLLSNILKKWNYEVVRGSSSSGGNIALGIMIDFAKNNFSVAVTPDGPRGPSHKFKAGAVITAKKSGIPLILAGVGFKKKKKLNNWDKFEVPYFFSKANIVYSDPVYVNKNLSYDETSKVIEECEESLNILQAKALKF